MLPGLGLPEMTSLAIDQILRLAPLIRPPMEPVVSRTKQISMGRPGGCFCGAAGPAACAGGRRVRQTRRAKRAVADFMGHSSGWRDVCEVGRARGAEVPA